MFIHFDIRDIDYLADSIWGERRSCQDYLLGLSISSKTGYFLIKKIIQAFQYQILEEQEIDGDTVIKTDIPFDLF